MKTAVFYFNKAMLGRAPLSSAELTPGLNTRGDASYAALELEARCVLAIRYAGNNKIARTRRDVAVDLLQSKSKDKSGALAAFNVQNQALEELSRIDYLVSR